jgi:hypothetical protein
MFCSDLHKKLSPLTIYGKNNNQTSQGKTCDDRNGKTAIYKTEDDLFNFTNLGRK